MITLLVLLFGAGCAIAAGAWVYSITVSAAESWVEDNAKDSDDPFQEQKN